MPFFKPARSVIFAFCLLFTGDTLSSADPSVVLLDAEVLGIDPADQLAVPKLRKLLDAVSVTEGAFTQNLYRPLRLLGSLQYLAGEHEAALDTFRRMQHIVHRNRGVYSMLQVESIDYVIGVLGQMGRLGDIDTQHHFRFGVVERNYPPKAPERLWAQLKLADWYRNTSRFRQASRLYEDVAGHLPEDATGMALRLTRAQALTHYLAGACCAEEAMAEAVDIVRASPTADRTEIEDVMIDYVDMAYLHGNRPAPVSSMLTAVEPRFLGFRRAADFVEIAHPQPLGARSGIIYGEPDDERVVYSLGHPVALCSTTYGRIVNHHSEDLMLSINLTVDDSGRPQDISIEGEAPHQLKRYVRDSLMASRYRPAIDERGEFVRAEMNFEQTFEPQNSNVGSSSDVADWHQLLVAQTCQRHPAMQI